jgi:UDP-N-acetyl-D-mannosaminuronate dehydrogenase
MKRDVAIVGAGYVGVPLARTFADAGTSVLLVDVDPGRVAQLNAGDSYIEDVPTDVLKPLVEAGLVAATTDYDELREVDAILVALPTPLSRQREPDLRILVSAAEQIATRLRAGHLVVLESTTYPGTTREQVQTDPRAWQRARRRQGFHLAFSPERVDPGREDWTTKTVPKVVGGIDDGSTAAAAALYAGRDRHVHTVSSPEAAELTKLLENIFRSVNIALVNELAQLCDRMGIDVWEVVEAQRRSRSASCPSSPGPASAATASRSTRSTSPGRRASSASRRVHRARGEGQRVDAVLLPLDRLPGAQPRAPALAHGSKILVIGVAYKPGHLRHARVALRSSSSGSSRRLGPTSPTTTRTCPRSRRTG